MNGVFSIFKKGLFESRILKDDKIFTFFMINKFFRNLKCKYFINFFRISKKKI